MLNWIINNLATIIISIVLIGICAAIILGMVKNKKRGKSACGCGCADCQMKGACHKDTQK